MEERYKESHEPLCRELFTVLGEQVDTIITELEAEGKTE